MASTMRYIHVQHNMEVAHRLFLQPGKCQNIHGHSMQVKLELKGDVNEEGIFAGIDFSDLKKLFRGYIDSRFDHHLLLNVDDPFAGESYGLPGLHRCDGDPTTENLAKWICEYMREEIYAEYPNSRSMIHWISIEIQETGTNGASYSVGTVR